ncbi:HET-E1 [Symbiodinium natans]|uniref:HET-E1 protein n=1 Tax=Symbiodinium natans TaxID=878477 RepID=A0A812UXV4_9DINO|nr:HET-E1 [Symbiodinium natans]
MAGISTDRMREEVRKLLVGVDLRSTSVGQLRASLEKSLGVAPGALDSQKDEVQRIFFCEIAELNPAEPDEDKRTERKDDMPKPGDAMEDESKAKEKKREEKKKAKDKKDKKEKKEKKDSNKKHADANQNKKRRTADEGKGENAPDAAAAGVTGRPGSSGDKILVAPKEELRQPQEAEEAQEAQEAEEAEEADEDGLEAEDVDDEMPEKAPAPPLDAASGLRGLPAAASVSTIPQPVRASAMVLSGSEDGTVRLWDLELETKCIRVLEGHMGTVHSLTVSWDTFEAVSGADDSSKLWNLKLGGCQKTMTEIPEGCTAVEADWRGRRALAGCGDGSLRVWSMSTAELQTTLQAHRGGVWALQADFEHKKLVSAGDENFKVWDVSDWTCLRTSEGHAGGLMCVSVNWTKSQLLAGAGSSTKRLQLWNLDSAPGGEKTRTDAEPDVLQGHQDVVADLAVDWSSGTAVTAGWDAQLIMWNLEKRVGAVAQIKEEMARWDNQRRIAEASMDEKLEAMLQKLEAQRFALEQKESTLHHMQRNLERVANEVNRLVEDQDAVRDVCEARVDEQSRRFTQFKAETEVRFASMERQHNALSDELWGDELGLAKIAGELKKTNATFGKLEDAVSALQEGKAEAVQLEKLRADVAKMVHEAKTSTSQMRQTVGEVVNDVREHFRTASETIASHNANFVKQVREEYQVELSNSAKLREEVKSFMNRATQSVESLELRVDEVASKANALASEAREELEELNRRRKRDKTSADNELKALKKRLGGVFDNSDAVLRGIEHIYSVLQPVLESELMQCALEKQDSVDRDRISLMGVKDDELTLARTTHTEPQRPRPECRVTTAPGGMKPSKMDASHGLPQAQKPVVRVDNRCVSCSGQAPLVLAAFKMACLHYAPSPIDYRGAAVERYELLDRREQLLLTANRSLLQGPSAFDGPGDEKLSPRPRGLHPDGVRV